MPFAQGLPTDLQRLPVERLRLLIPSRIRQKVGEIVEPSGVIGMPFAQGLPPASRSPGLSLFSSVVTSTPYTNSIGRRCLGHVGREGAGDTPVRTIAEAQSTVRSTKDDWERDFVNGYIAQAQAAVGDVEGPPRGASSTLASPPAILPVEAGDTQGAARTVSEALSIARISEDWRRASARIAQVQVRARHPRTVSEALSIAPRPGNASAYGRKGAGGHRGPVDHAKHHRNSSATG